MVIQRPPSRLLVVLFTDIVDSVGLKSRLGDSAAAELIHHHDKLFQYTVSAFPLARILRDLGDGFLASFASASDAVHAALHFQHSLRESEWNHLSLQVRIGLHLGEVSEMEHEAGGADAKISGLAVDIAHRVMTLALPGQILMTRAAFDNARQYVRELTSSYGGSSEVARKWIAHGRYLFHGTDEPLEVFEVGEVGIAPLTVPPDTEKSRRAVAADQEVTLGWRPAVGLNIPDRKGWVLDRKLGEGGFGEVWLGEHLKARTHRVFKFCFDADRLRSFKRELMLFRILRDSLGDRDDIAKLYEVQVDQAPFYLESEFTEEGSLVEWTEAQGGIEKVGQATRLELVARTAQAIAAAHSVGILHKDIKPSNILIYRTTDGSPRPRITDFGIGVLTDPSKLKQHDITLSGLTQSIIDDDESARTGTRLYTPPEALVGKPPTIQGDVYALGVLLYQMVVGDLDRPLAQGWERDVSDPLLRHDITVCVEGHEEDRLSSAAELGRRLLNLPRRRRAMKRRRAARVSVAASLVLVVLLSLSAAWIMRERRMRFQKEQEAEKAVSISQFLQDMLASVDPREGQGLHVTVASRLDQAVSQLDAGAVEEKEIEASLRWTIGNAYLALSAYQVAQDQHARALAIRRDLFGSQNLEVAQSLQDLAAAKWHSSLFDEAEPLYRESLEIRRALLGEEHLVVASSLNHLAACRDAQGDHDEAEQLYRRALGMRRRLAGPEHRELVARSLNNLGTCLLKREECDEATGLFEEATEIMRELRGDRHIDVASGLTNLARCLLELGRLAEAEPLFLQALSIKREEYREPHSSLAVTLHWLATMYFRQGKFDDALRYCSEAMSVREAVFRPDHPKIVESKELLDDIKQAMDASTE